MKIFISYRSLDREAVRSLVHNLEDIGHEVWSDLHITGGQDWWENILEGIRQSDLFLFGLTQNWFDSDTCLREFDYASSLGKNRLPVRLGEMPLEKIPQQVRRLQIVDYAPNSDNAFRQLQRAINRLPPPAPAPHPLPTPPESPLEPLERYDQELRKLRLERDAQAAMVFELKRVLRRQQNATQARQLLEALQKHPDTGDTIASRIERALSESNEPQPERITEEMMPIVLTDPHPPRRPRISLDDVSHLAPLATFTQHTDTVHAVAFSPNSALLASGSADKTVRLWNMVDGQPFAMLRGHNGAVRDINFSPSGLQLASSAADGTVRLWGISGSREIHTLSGHEDWVLRVQYSPRGNVLASTSVDEMTILWDANTRQELGTLGGHGDWVTGAAFSPDSTTLATASYDSTIRFWNVARRKRQHMMFSGVGMAEDIVFTPDGVLLAVSFQDGTVRLYSMGQQAEVAVLEGHNHTVYKIAFSPDGQMLASGGADGTIRLWDMNTYEPCAALTGHEGPVWGVTFSPDGTLMASSSEDGTVCLWGLVG